MLNFSESFCPFFIKFDVSQASLQEGGKIVKFMITEPMGPEGRGQNLKR